MLVKILGIIILYGAICLVEIPGLQKRGYGREIVIFLAFLLPALVLSVLIAVGVKFPQIIPAIAKVLEPLIIWFGD